MTGRRDPWGRSAWRPSREATTEAVRPPLEGGALADVTFRRRTSDVLAAIVDRDLLHALDAEEPEP